MFFGALILWFLCNFQLYFHYYNRGLNHDYFDNLDLLKNCTSVHGCLHLLMSLSCLNRYNLKFLSRSILLDSKIEGESDIYFWDIYFPIIRFNYSNRLPPFIMFPLYLFIFFIFSLTSLLFDIFFSFLLPFLSFSYHRWNEKNQQESWRQIFSKIICQ